jgi:hypothetical protein
MSLFSFSVNYLRYVITEPALIQNDWFSYKEEKFGHKKDVKTQAEDSQGLS